MSARECRAVRIATELRRTHGDGALRFASTQRDAAMRRRDARRADLYVAVRTLLDDGAAIFQRSRGAFGGERE